MKIDAFCHLMPRPYFDRFFELDVSTHAANLRKRVSNIPSLVDMDVRFRQMDEFGDYRQIINIAAPPVEDLGSPQVSKELSRIGNEAMAELVHNHPDRFAGFTACVPMDDPDAAVTEFDYAVKELGVLGAQIYTHVHGHAMDGKEFDPFYARVAELGKLLQAHPCRSANWADYPAEERSRYEIWWTFRVGVRPVGVHGQAGVLRGSGALPGAQAADPSRRQHGAALRRPSRPGVGPAWRPHPRGSAGGHRGLPADQAAHRLLRDNVRRHRHVRSRPCASVRHRLLRC